MDNSKINSEEKNNRGKRAPRKKRNIGITIILGFFKTIGVIILLAIMFGTVFAGAVGGSVIKMLQKAPAIDPTLVNHALDETSTIYDQNGNLIEKIQAEELRTFVKIEEIPLNLKKAFIAIEDERFYDHIGVDPIGIAASMLDNVKAGGIVRGGSTITQQIVKNKYLSSEKKLERKIVEAYLALQMEKVLTKDQILEAYLNQINLGQNAYGVQEAAQTYFSKDIQDLTLAECAVLAGIPKSPSRFAPFQKVDLENFDSNTMYEVGRVDVLGEKYVAVYNQESVDRQKVVLRRMYELGRITYDEYMSALDEDIKTSLKPGKRKLEDISSYFTDYVKTQAQEELMKRLDISKEDAQDMLFRGGLKIYSTIDVEMQRKLENIYENFTNILAGKEKAPILINWKLDKAGNIIDQDGTKLYYKKENIMTDNGNLRIDNGSFEINDLGLFVKTPKLTPYAKHIDITDYYLIDDKKNLVTYTLGSIVIPEGQFALDENRRIYISSDFLRNNPDFYELDGNGNIIINNKFFYSSNQGIVQPQSAFVAMDYNGEIKVLIGGRDVEGARILNRATSRRQPGSLMKPISVYLPALDNGFTTTSVIEDSPFSEEGGTPWPRNFYTGYRGLTTLRNAVVISINTCTVKVLNSVGIDKSMSYLKKMGIIDPLNPGNDDFISADENPKTNDQNLAALALGGMTRGVTPLNLTAAYGAIANDGMYNKPTAITRIENSKGEVIFQHEKLPVQVVSPQVAYIMKDILKSVVYDGYAKQAIIGDIVVAGKTGTTQNRADIWFAGFTPYYISTVWIGNDAPKIELNTSSPKATEFWGYINKKIHEGLEPVSAFKMPSGIIRSSVCSESGKQASELCSRDPRGSRLISDIFVEGTLPTELCDVHITAAICNESNLLATDFCPVEAVEERVFIKRPGDGSTEAGEDEVKTDYEQYYVPLEKCNIHSQETQIIDMFEDIINNPNITPPIGIPGDDNTDDNNQPTEPKTPETNPENPPEETPPSDNAGDDGNDSGDGY
ncbi:MAG: PBP1A family penicillin-binding protein [Tissierellia bacterium]|nr:PBP1A family penicillin-binding protein [Tissierellia bacterium]